MYDVLSGKPEQASSVEQPDDSALPLPAEKQSKYVEESRPGPGKNSGLIVTNETNNLNSDLADALEDESVSQG